MEALHSAAEVAAVLSLVAAVVVECLLEGVEAVGRVEAEVRERPQLLPCRAVYTDICR